MSRLCRQCEHDESWHDAHCLPPFTGTSNCHLEGRTDCNGVHCSSWDCDCPEFVGPS
jgi:hypothetical protein